MKQGITTLVLVAVFTGGWLLFANNSPQVSEDETITTVNGSLLSETAATVYKSPTCGCCVGYSKEARKIGMDVDIVEVDDMDEIKNKYDIPREMSSCHTTVIGDYFIEGHVPFEAIEKLLTEKPNIDGIALPNMPAGSPGMPGIKRGPFVVYQLTDGEYTEFIKI